jgi:septal ring factor EnvC (AmiA/AmiB activator)
LTIVGRSEAQPPPAQSRADLEKERAAIQKEIEDVRQSLDETHKNKRETLGQLALLQRRLRLRESAIRNINAQIDVIQGDMNESWREILKLRRSWIPSRSSTRKASCSPTRTGAAMTS